jgi:EAL domain-containing protein (putative c-di-GMP-specific phosphodiesterase class I)
VHPTEGFVPPDVFIPLAEQAGLIPALTASVLRTALGAVARWRSWGHSFTMSVNLSARMLREPAFLDEVDTALCATGLPAHGLMLEITESAVMEDVTAARAMLDDLRRRGVRLSLDDFGTGHSSLAHLATLPVDELKLDKTFVLGLPQDVTSLAIVRAAIDLAHQLGLTVVAEGVETVEAQDVLVHGGCDIVQGYLHSRPLPVHDFEDWLQARSGAFSRA